MPRVIGIDPGTISIDLCGLDDGRIFLDTSLPTVQALADPSVLLTLLQEHAPLDLVVGPSGYGLPLKRAGELTETDLTLAFLAAPGEAGGIGGLRSLVRALAASALPVMLTPGVIHLASVPDHRKVNRVDMGTADKVCAVALAIHEYAARHRCRERDASFVLLELGGAFTAAIAVRAGQIVDGIAGSAGPLGARAAGALDAEVAFLAGTFTKRMVFEGGVASIAGAVDADSVELFSARTLAGRAYVESAVKAVISAAVSLTEDGSRRRDSFEVMLSGRLAGLAEVRDELTERLAPFTGGGSVQRLTGLAQAPTDPARQAKHAAQGAALIADGLAGGSAAAIVDALGIRDARGTVLDHLHVISADAARARLGIAP